MTPTVEVPESAAGVVGALSPGAVVIAGGTQVMPRINTEAHDVDTLVSLRHAGLAGMPAATGFGPTAPDRYERMEYGLRYRVRQGV
jgi:CO/xanthine dehydrogenase FAD-binding subunit